LTNINGKSILFSAKEFIIMDIKKSFFMLLTVLIIAFISAGCSNDGSSGPAPLTISFNQDIVYVEVGGPVRPSSLMIIASQPVTEDTVISLVSSSLNLTVPSQVTIPEGGSSTAVPLTGNTATASSITLTASCDGQTPTADVMVHDDSSTRSVVSLEPDPLTTTAGSTESVEVFLDLPAPSGGTTVSLGTTGGIGSVPAAVTVTSGNFSTDFNFTASGSAAAGTITATFTTTASSDVTVTDP
jgi:hypothetical protein